MELNKLIMESIKNVIVESKEKKQKTSVQYGGPNETSIKDQNVEGKNKASIDVGLERDIAKENKNPQGEGGKNVVKQNPKLAAAVTAGIVNVGAKIVPNKDVKFTPPASATK